MNRERLVRRLAGVVAVPVTPMHADGGIDEDGYRRVVRRLAGGGVGVVTPNGNTGEFYALSPQEARRCAELTVESAGPAAVLAGVGHDTASAVESARHAAGLGVEMIMVHQPVHPYGSPDGWIDYHRRVAERVPDLGVVLYLRDPRITGAHVARLGELCPNVVGVKYGVPDPVRFAGVAEDAGDRFAWLCGLAEAHAPAYWPFGARGFTSGLANVAPRMAVGLLDALRAGDAAEVRRLWSAIRPFEALRNDDGGADNVSVVKQALAHLGVCGATVRPPSRALGGERKAAVAKIVSGWDAAAPA